MKPAAQARQAQYIWGGGDLDQSSGAAIRSRVVQPVPIGYRLSPTNNKKICIAAPGRKRCSNKA
jgi:hypothetical protein